MSYSGKIEGVVILADESANWILAGLRQLDRLALALDEYSVAVKSPGPIPVCVTWIREQPAPPQRFPRHARLTHLSFTDDLSQFAVEKANAAAILVVDTRLVLGRDSVTSILRSADAGKSGPWRIVRGAHLSRPAIEHSMSVHEHGTGAGEWYYLNESSDIRVTEKHLLSATGKSQDGVISRYVNRPLSRLVSGWLVHTSLRPSQVTLILMIIPLIGSLFLLRGDYLGFALGAILFQLHSALDGCDGEIARLKYEESAAGRKLDGLCDRFSTLLYAVTLGIGLSRHPGVGEVMRWVYPLEGVLAALLIGVSETWLTRVPLDEYVNAPAGSSDAYPEFVKEQRPRFNEGDQLKLWALRNSGLLFWGKGAASLFAEVTKRDVFNFGFMLLALCGWPQVILHILAVCACAIAVFAVKDVATLRQPDGGGLISPP